MPARFGAGERAIQRSNEATASVCETGGSGSAGWTTVSVRQAKIEASRGCRAVSVTTPLFERYRSEQYARPGGRALHGRRLRAHPVSKLTTPRGENPPDRSRTFPRRRKGLGVSKEKVRYGGTSRSTPRRRVPARRDARSFTQRGPRGPGRRDRRPLRGGGGRRRRRQLARRH